MPSDPFQLFYPSTWPSAVEAASAPGFWILAIVALLLALAAFYGVFRFYHRARIMQDTPTSKVRSAAQGFVELKGRAELMDGPPIVAPLSGHPCVWYRYKIERRESVYTKGHRRSHWRTVDSGCSEELFLLVDDTGRCVIDPEGAEVTTGSRQVWYGSQRRPEGTAPRAAGGAGGFLAGLGQNYRYTEELLRPGESLYALGLFQTVGGDNDGRDIEGEVRSLLSAWKRDPEMLQQRFDVDGDGRIDLKEWEIARRTARQQVLDTRLYGRGEMAANMLTRPRHSGRPFILSVQPQDRLARRFSGFALASLTGFLVSGSFAVWLLTIRLA